MKKLLILYFSIPTLFPVIILLSTMIACSNYQDDSKRFQKVLGNNHELRKFNVKTTTSSSTSAWYFLVMGGYSSETTSDTKVRFYFMNYKGEFQLMEMRLNEINIKIDSTAKVPYVKFDWRQPDYEVSEENIYDFVERAVICCKENDFQPQININDLK